ncbi:MAG: hypothetical protein PVH88_07730 [Ignavibacteria bacterium]|jgi:hypothetical protein
METNFSKKEFWYKTYQLLSILGFILCLGSIFSFIVMNIVLGKTPSIDPIYWQWLFVSGITKILIIPGISLVLIGTVLLSWKYYGFFTKEWVTIVQILFLFIITNSINIILLEEKVTAIAVHQKQIMASISEYIKLKSKKDIFGAVNMLMLLTSLIILIYKHRE